jgi:AcrR family transcriptional regulator
MVQAPSRRDRVRAATTEEIKQTARRILVVNGPDAVSLRAIARQMGMTAPALYRYFDSREDLIKHVVADIFTEAGDRVYGAIDGARAVSDGDLTEMVVAACSAFRGWALDHRAEFGLIFGNPLPGIDLEHDDITSECGRKFGGTFLALIIELWRKHPFPVPAVAEIDQGLREQLERYRDGLGVDLPLGVIVVYLRCWVRLYGILSLEVFGHLSFALDDASPMFEYFLADTAPLLGLRYLPPGERRWPAASVASRQAEGSMQNDPQGGTA